MRKINSSQDKIRKQKRNQIIFGILLVIIMVFSTLGYAFGGGESSEEEGVERIDYNGKYFFEYGSAWISEEEPRIFLTNNPQNVSQEFFFVNGIDSYEDQPLYISYNESFSSFFIYDNLSPIALRMQQACLEKGCKEELPVKNCSNNFIIIEEYLESSVVQEENCVFIKGNSEDLSKLVDSFILEIFGIK
jgi:hypothetical protein